MITKKVAEELLKQVNREFLSERLYIAMEYYFKSLDLNVEKLHNPYMATFLGQKKTHI